MEAVNRCVWTFPDSIHVAANLDTLSLQMGRIVMVSISQHIRCWSSQNSVYLQISMNVQVTTVKFPV